MQCSLFLVVVRKFYGLSQIFRPKFEEDHHNFAGIEIQTKLYQLNLFLFFLISFLIFENLIMHPTKTIISDFASLIEKKREEN
jgi:hypothetical protein